MNYKNYHKNPRSITEDQKDNLSQWINELGDISGIVQDVNTDEVVSGNQRSDVINLDTCTIEINKEFNPPNEQGTIKEGIVINSSGARLNYRLVDWTPEQCEKANIVANKAGGTWNWEILETEFQKEDLIEWGFDESEFCIVDDYSKKNKEYSEDDFEDKMTIKLEYSYEEYQAVNQQILLAGETAEQIFFKALGL